MSSSLKLTPTEYTKLDTLFRRIQPPAQSALYNSGDHYELYKALCAIGFRPPKEATDIYRMAEEVLANGHE